MSALPPAGASSLGARLHAAVAAMFFAFGIGVGLWGGASGAILIRAGVDAATFGVLLTVFTGAYLIAMSAGGAVAHRFGIGQALSVSAVIFGAALCALLDASSETWVAIALIVAGFLGGVVDLLMNAEGARIERRLGRPILARLHAAASAGMALGAILGSLIVVGPAPWAAGVLAAFALAGAGVAYPSRGGDRSSRSGGGRVDRAKRIVLRAGSDWAWGRGRRLDRGGTRGVGVVVAAVARGSAEAGGDFWPWRGVLFRLPGCAAVQRRRDSPSGQRPSHHHRLIRDRGRRLRSGQHTGRVSGERRGLRFDRRRHRTDRPMRLRARRASGGGRTRGRARFRVAVQRADAAARAVGDGSDRASLVVCRLRSPPSRWRWLRQPPRRVSSLS